MINKSIFLILLILLSGCAESYYSSERHKINKYFDKADELCSATAERIVSGAYKVSWWDGKLTVYCIDNTEIKIKYNKNDDE